MATSDQHHASTISCEGWWEQDVFGRQPMEGLQLSIAGGQLNGMGHDIVGVFSLTGVISQDGAVVIRKRYFGAHDVDYVGTYDGEGVLWGDWQIGGHSGPWLIRFRRVESAGDGTIRELFPPKSRGN